MKDACSAIRSGEQLGSLFSAMFDNKTFVKTNLTEPNHSRHDVAVTVAKCLVFFITITATMVGNSFIYAAMKQFRSLRTPTNIVLCSLASTDLAMVVVMVLHAITDVSGHWISTGTLCDFVATLGLVLAFISILHLCFLSIDRYLAIKNPLRYLLLVTRRRVYIVLVLIWLMPSIFLNLPAADYGFRSEVYGCASSNAKTTALEMSPYIFIFVAFFVVIPFSIMLFTNAAVFRVALSHVKRMSTIERQLYETSTSETSSYRETTTRRPHNTLLLKREIKSAKTFALVIGVFLVCYTPFFVTGTYRKVVGREGVPYMATFITTWLAFANSFSNPLLLSPLFALQKSFQKTLLRSRFKDN